MTSRGLALGAGFVIVCVLGGAGLWLNRQAIGPATFSVPNPRSAALPAVAPKSPETATTMPGGHGAGLSPSPNQAATAPPAQPGEPAAPLATAGEEPKFDIVRVEPSGDTVLAGRGAPRSKVALMASGKVVAETKADANGNFVLIPPPLTPGDHDLTLRQDAEGKAPVVSQQSVAVKVPKRGGGAAIVALAEPGKATQLLSDSSTAAGAPKTASIAPASNEPSSQHPSADASQPAADPKLAFRSVELENGDGFYATGIAKPGTKVEVYLNDSRIAGVTAAPSGLWSLKVLKGLAAGHYTVRAEAVGDGHTVVARAEVPFDVPVAMAETVKRQQTANANSSGPSAPASSVLIGGAPPTSMAGGAASKPSQREPGSTPNAAAATPAPTNSQQAAASSPMAATGEGSHAAGLATPSTAGSDKPSNASAATVAADVNVGAGSAVIEALETARVIGGDSLWRISRTRLGQGHRYTQIYAANAAQIRNPDRIYPDQVFVMPHR